MALRWLFALCLAASAQAAWAACSLDRVSLRGDWGTAEFTVELAETPQARGVGLMNRDHLDRNAGMLFIFDPPQRVSFWMRNTRIPLDMLFIDRQGVVRRIHENAIPFDETSIPGGRNVYGVLEVNGGLTEVFGFDVGTQVRHPRFAPEAAWPCQ